MLQIGSFRFDPATGELSKVSPTASESGLRLRPQAAQILTLLAESPGRLVTRGELQDAVWSDTTVDFDQGLNTCVREIRTALGDDASAPDYVETVPRRGYRLVAQVTPLPLAKSSAEPSFAPPGAPQGDRSRIGPPPASPAAGPRRILGFGPGVLLVVALGLLTGLVWASLGRDSTAPPTELDPTGDRRLLLVLPISHEDSTSDQEILATGLTEQLIVEMTRLQPEGLGVIAPSSAFQLKGDPRDPLAIARQLEADFLMEGEVRRDDDRMWTTIRLTRSADGTLLWAQQWEQTVDDFLTVQRQVATEVADALALEILPKPREWGPPLPAARQAWLRGRYLLLHGDRDDLSTARRLLEEAHALDPGHGPLAASLASALRLTGDPDQARALVEEVLARDPQLSQAHLLRAIIALIDDLDLPTARHHLDIALELDPGRAQVHQFQGFYWSFVGEHERAVAAMERADRLDPVSIILKTDVGWIYFFARRFREAQRQCEVALELDPKSLHPQLCLLEVALISGELEVARQWAISIIRHREGSESVVEEVANAPGGRWLEIYGRWLLRRIDEDPPPEQWLWIRTARAWILLDEPAKALTALERGFDRPSSALLTLPSDPRFDALRGDPRFERLVHRIQAAKDSRKQGVSPGVLPPSQSLAPTEPG